MPVSLDALHRRIQELERLADEVLAIAEQASSGRPVKDELARKGQQWYRGARAFLVEHESSSLAEFDACYDTSKRPDAPRGGGRPPMRQLGDIESYTAQGVTNSSTFEIFKGEFRKARALVAALVEEVASRALSLRSQLSLEVTADELDAAQALLADWGGREVIMRAAGVVARIALERQLFTLADTKSVAITKNPPTKPKATADDVLVSLQRGNVITALQKRQIEDLLAVGNACAHPEHPVTYEDVQRLIREGKQIAATLV